MRATYRLGFPPFALMRRELDRAFNDLFADTPRAFPALNVWEDQGNLYAEAELPGLRMEDLEILIQGNELTLRGRRAEPNGADAVYHRRERGVGEFSRFVALPVDVNADAVSAVLKDGVLTITMPKAESARARKIEVRAAN